MHKTILQKDIHQLAIKICTTLQEKGHQAFIVGGCVRDLLLDITPKDWDITTSASPDQILTIFPKTIPTGIKHGTITVCMGEGKENHFEVTTFRVEGKYTDGRRPEEVKFVQQIEEDLARRDLTINAMAYDPVKSRMVDPFAGIYDLHNDIIRTVGSPSARFQEDGLRIMRVARFASRFSFQIEEETKKGMKISQDTLRKVSKERISDELRKILMSPNPFYGLITLQETEILPIVCPLLGSVLISKFTLQSELETRLACLYNKQPIDLVEKELIDLKFSNKEIKRTIFLLNSLKKFYFFKEDSTLLAYKKFMARIKNESPDPWSYTYQQFIELARVLQLPFEKLTFYDEEVVPARNELVINGNDLMEMGITPGPQFKRVLDICYQHILEHPEDNIKERLMTIVEFGRFISEMT